MVGVVENESVAVISLLAKDVRDGMLHLSAYRGLGRWLGCSLPDTVYGDGLSALVAW